MAQETNKATDLFKQTIDNYLKVMAANDAAFAARLALPEKSLDDCCKYIFGVVQKSGNCGFADSEIYGLAVHYYDEDNIEIGNPSVPTHIVVNHTIELTPEEIAEAREKAKEKLVQEQIQRLRKPETKPVAATPAKAEQEPCLF